MNASHEWVNLHLNSKGVVRGEPNALSRFISLGRFIFIWYGIISLIYFVAVILAGLYFFQSHSLGISWKMQWVIYSLFSAGALWLMPFLSILEGCNQYASTAFFRLVQSIVSTLGLWVILMAGLNLWALPVLSGLSLLAIFYYLFEIKKDFFKIFLLVPRRARISWKKELLPMQWRLASQGFFGYFSFPIYPILAFNISGAIASGKMGMTLQIMNAMLSLSMVFIMTRAPSLALHAAKGEIGILSTKWKAASIQSIAFMLIMQLLLLGGIYLGNTLGIEIFSRVLPIKDLIFLSAGTALALIIQCLAVYIRSFKRERLTFVGVISGVSYITLAYILGYKSGVFGISLSYFLVTLLIAVPLSLIIFSNEIRINSK